MFPDWGRDVQEVEIRDGDLGRPQRLCDEEGQNVNRQGAYERHHPGTDHDNCRHIYLE